MAKLKNVRLSTLVKKNGPFRAITRAEAAELTNAGDGRRVLTICSTGDGGALIGQVGWRFVNAEYYFASETEMPDNVIDVIGINFDILPELVDPTPSRRHP